MSKRTKKQRDPLAGIPPELQAKMRDPAWREAFNAPLTPALAAKVMPPVDVLALMLARWLRLPAVERRREVEFHQRMWREHPSVTCLAVGAAMADVIEALDLVIAAANAQPGDGVKDGAR